MKENKITEETVRLLVTEFYSKVRADNELGLIFFKAIGNDPEGWASHLHKLCNFWSSIMLGSKCYHGSPFQKHQMLPPFDRKLFERWLMLFEQTAHEIHTADIVDQYMEKGKRIAKSLQIGLYDLPRHSL